MLAYEATLGDIVSLNSHPYSEDYSETVIAGEHLLTPPLMVVAEILKDNKTQFNERTGEEESRIGFSQCKCIWYSHKTNQYEEAWISSKMLKLIKKNGTIESRKDTEFYKLVTLDTTKPYEPKFKKYYSVVLKTNELELGKRKSSKSLDENSIIENKEEKVTINAYLAFVSPVMEVVQIIDAKDVEQKDAKFNPKNGERRKLGSEWFAKVKWFNAASEKFSEKILPICVLEKIEPVNREVLQQIKEAITNQTYFEHRNANSIQTLLKPKAVVYKSGYYFLKAFDYITNTHSHMPIPDSTFDLVDKYYTDSFPKFEFINTGSFSDNSVEQEIIKGIGAAKKSGVYIRIKYKNRNDKLSFRTLKSYEIKPVTSSLRAGEGRVINYLEGVCQSCKEIRTFRVDEIQKVQILNIRY
jgi:hypothetical protein